MQTIASLLDVRNSSATTAVTASSTLLLSTPSFGNYTCMGLPAKEGEIATKLAQGVSPEQIFQENYMQNIKLRIPVWIFAVCSLYVAIMLTVHEAKRDLKQRREKYANFIQYARVGASWFTFVALAYFSLSLFVETNEADCTWYGKTENTLCWLNISMIYVVLWLRQRLIFKQPNLSHLTSHVTSFLSLATIVLVIALPVLNTLLFATFSVFCSHPILKTCVLSQMNGPKYIHLLGELIVPTLVPITLLALFSYPIIRHHLQMVKASRGQRPVVRILCRISIATFVCLITDIAAGTCNDFCPPQASFVVRRTSLFVNFVCMVATFTDCRDVLFPRRRTEKPEVVNVPTVTQTHSGEERVSSNA